jgi:hypothetical protein
MDGLLVLVQYWRFVSLSRIVCRYLADGPPWARGQSTRSSRTARLVLQRIAKSFASLFVLQLCDCLEFVPRVGRSAVTP